MIQWAELTHLYGVFEAIGSTAGDLEKAISAVGAACDEIIREAAPERRHGDVLSSLRAPGDQS